MSQCLRRFIYYIILVSLSTLFSNFFEKLFCCFLMTFVIGENFLILLQKLFLVNTFFKLFWKYFLSFFDDFFLKRELSYITTSHTFLSISFFSFFIGKIKNDFSSRSGLYIRLMFAGRYGIVPYTANKRTTTGLTPCTRDVKDVVPYNKINNSCWLN